MLTVMEVVLLSAVDAKARCWFKLHKNEVEWGKITRINSGDKGAVDPDSTESAP